MLFIREVTLSSSSCSNISSIHNNRSAPLKCIPTRSTWIAILVDWLPVCLLSKYKYEQRNNEVEEEGGEYLEIAQDLPLYCLSSSALWEVEAALLRCDWCRYRKSSGFISGIKENICPWKSCTIYWYLHWLEGSSSSSSFTNANCRLLKRAISHWLQLSYHYYYYFYSGRLRP